MVGVDSRCGADAVAGKTLVRALAGMRAASGAFGCRVYVEVEPYVT